jgi:hypothetical protein
VINVAKKIATLEGVICDIVGRGTVLSPGEAYQFCRKRNSAKMIRQESLTPEERITGMRWMKSSIGVSKVTLGCAFKNSFDMHVTMRPLEKNL